MRTIISSTLVLLVFSSFALSQARSEAKDDPLDTLVTEFQLHDETIFDGLAKLNELVPISISIEYLLKPTIKGAAPAIPKFTERVSNATISDILNWLCRLDPRYTWTRNKNNVNIVPVDMVRESSYLMNRVVHRLILDGVTTPDGAVVQSVLQLPGPKVQIANLQAGGNWKFSKPWSEELSEVSVREVANNAARRLGATFGWQLTGSQDFRVIIFHAKLLPHAPLAEPTTKK